MRITIIMILQLEGWSGTDIYEQVFAVELKMFFDNNQ